MPAARIRRIAEHTRYLEVENQASLKWCSECAITIEELSGQLSFSFVLTSVEQEFRDTFQQSRERAQACLENSDAAGDLYLRHAGNLDLLYSIAKSIDARRVVETGVAYGWSSLALLLAVKDKDGGYVYSTDLPRINALLSGDDDRIGIGVAVPDSLRTRWRLFKMADREGLPRALRKARGGVDLAHYDSDKTPEGRAFGYAIIWKHLRKGGILISDDVGDNLEFKRFSEKVGRTPIVVDGNTKYQGILIK